MKTIWYSKVALKGFAKHRNRAALILEKIEAYAADPASQANNVKAMTGERTLRLRVGGFRVILEESETEISVLEVGPRSGIYD